MDLFKPKPDNDIINDICKKYNIINKNDSEYILNIYKLVYIVNCDENHIKRYYLSNKYLNQNNLISDNITRMSLEMCSDDIFIDKEIKKWGLIYKEIKKYIFKNINNEKIHKACKFFYDDNFDLNEIILFNKNNIDVIIEKYLHIISYVIREYCEIFIIMNEELNIFKLSKITPNIIIDNSLKNSIILGIKPINLMNNFGLFLYKNENNYKIVNTEKQYCLNLQYKLV